MNNLNKGKFIVFEGINGSGKTTIINILINYLEDHSIKYKYIKFPNRKTETGKIIDDFLKNKYEFKSLQEQIKIFAENRKESHNIIKDYLNTDHIILCDRYLYSNLAYTLTDQTLNIINNKTTEFINMNSILKYDANLIKPNFVFLIKGNYIQLRNEKIQERYHNDEIKNSLIMNNYLLALNQTNTKYKIINNEFNKLEKTIQDIIKDIEVIDNNAEYEYF
jgi:dTMP kinase